MYKISIIIPVFNVEDTLKDSFYSIFNQDFGFDNLEVIFVDDCSTDESRKIINEFSDKYENVKSIFLDKNSGYAGKPRNIGIKNATSDYIMFLDPDDRFLENACSLLYENITNDNLDLVSANFNFINHDKKISNNWSQLNLEDGEIHVNSVKDEPSLFYANPAIWTKIYKKDFLVDNKIYFIENIPAQDFVFNIQSLLKANGIKFVDVSIVDYTIRYVGNNKSISSTRTKNNLKGYIKAYKESYKLLIGTDYVKFAVKPLFFWTKQLILADLPPQDKIDLLRFATPLYEKFIQTDLKLNYPFKPFFDKVNEKNFVGAVSLSKKLSLEFKDEIHFKLLEDIKNKNIFMLFWGLHEDIGGLAKAACNRSNLLYDNGYSVKLLNIDPLKNFKFIINKYKNLGYLHKSIKIINIFDYYSKKNTVNFEYDDIKKSKIENSIYYIIKTHNSDESVTLEYFNCQNREECSSKNKIFEELYFNECLALKKIFDNGSLIEEYYFTCDLFNYLHIDYKNKEFMLFDRNNDFYITFNSLQEFQDYFVTEICLNSSHKPFLINDCSGPTPSIKNISSDIAYKIGVVHNNPYLEPYCYGSSMRNIASLCDYEYEDAVVVLTDAAKMDFFKKFNSNKLVVIPNFITNEDLNKIDEYNIVKNDNVISIFARIAPEKNLEDIIKAFNLVLDKHPNVLLKIYGRALTDRELKEKRKLEKLIEKYEITNSIKFMGHVDNTYEEMAKSLCVAVVSHIEGLPMIILEAMVNGTPVVSYDVNYGPKDVITHDMDGYVVDQYDVESLSQYIIHLIENPDKAHRMGFNAKNKIFKNYSQDIVLNKWEVLFKEVYSKYLCIENDKYFSFFKD